MRPRNWEPSSRCPRSGRRFFDVRRVRLQPDQSGSTPMRIRIWLVLAGVIVVAAVVAAFAMRPLRAQRPRASPHESVSGTIDSANITVEYGRPYMRGRQIFGRLVPYGQVWCP